MLQQIQIPIRGLPIHLVLLSNGMVVFVRVAAFTAILEATKLDGSPYGYFFEEDFTLYADKESNEFSYNTMYAYKTIPVMLKWLKSQELQNPF